LPFYSRSLFCSFGRFSHKFCQKKKKVEATIFLLLPEILASLYGMVSCFLFFYESFQSVECFFQLS
jgi:hypothetical protein